MNEKLSRIFKHPLTVPIAVSLVAFGAGIGAGYILGRRSKVEIHEVPDQLGLTFDGIQEYVDTVKDNKSTLKAVEEIEDKVKPEVEEFITAKLKEVDEQEIDPKSVFAHNDEDWNYEEELKHRTTSAPYVLHKDEFYAEEMGYTQTTLMYYAGDDIMSDEDDKPVYNHESVTGPMKFGHGSSDPKVFHVRNDKRHAEYEIIYDEGLYSVEVLGLEIENNQRVEKARAKNIKHAHLNRNFKQE